jgi:superfamily II DNA/RNA helicase
VYFEDLDLSDNVLDALYDMRFEKCTPVQAQCIPPILEHHDVLGVAQTGTGKTAAYLLPLLTLLERDPHPADAVNCLVIAPTRELARQIDQALQGFAYYTGVNAVAVYGGNDGIRYEQERRSLIGEKDLYALSNIERTLKIKIPRAELPEGVRPPQTEPQHGRGGRSGGNGNGRGRNGGSREQRNSHGKRGGNDAQSKGRNDHRRNDKRQAQGGKPHGKSDNRPAAQKRPPKNGTGRKPE